MNSIAILLVNSSNEDSKIREIIDGFSRIYSNHLRFLLCAFAWVVIFYVLHSRIGKVNALASAVAASGGFAIVWIVYNLLSGSGTPLISRITQLSNLVEAFRGKNFFWGVVAALSGTALFLRLRGTFKRSTRLLLGVLFTIALIFIYFFIREVAVMTIEAIKASPSEVNGN